MIEVAARTDRRRAMLGSAPLIACLALLAAASATGQAVAVVAGLTLVVSAICIWPQFFTRWELPLAVLIAVILFVPIKRYKLPGAFPVDLELYRLVIVVVAGLWFLALLADRRVQLRRTLLGPPLLAVAGTVIGSVLTNFGPITFGLDRTINNTLADEVTKATFYLFSLLLVYVIFTSVVSSLQIAHFVLKSLVVGGAIVAFMSIVEARVGYNAFDSLAQAMPFLVFDPSIAPEILRGGGTRVYASAQTPIALGAVFVMLLPVSFAYARSTSHIRWWIVTGVIGLGTLSSLSRTPALMFLAVVAVFVVLRFAEVRRLLPGVVPALVVIHFVLPGAIGTYREAFFPTGGIVQEQTNFEGRVSSERLGPQFRQIRKQPVFGVGYGTQVTTGEFRNNFILDNQWLSTALETGLLGVAAWVWFFGRFIRRVGREAKRDPTPRGLLLTALVSSLAAFAVGMFTYDAFSFVQVTVVMLILAAVGAKLIDPKIWPASELRAASPDGLARPPVQPSQPLVVS